MTSEKVKLEHLWKCMLCVQFFFQMVEMKKMVFFQFAAVAVVAQELVVAAAESVVEPLPFAAELFFPDSIFLWRSFFDNPSNNLCKMSAFFHPVEMELECCPRTCRKLPQTKALAAPAGYIPQGHPEPQEPD